MSHSPLEKIQALDSIEKEIVTCLQSAGKVNTSSFRFITKHSAKQ